MLRTVILSFALTILSATSATAQTLLAWLERTLTSDSVAVTAFANGNVRGLASGGDQDQLATNGSLGLRLDMNRLTLSGAINVVSALDTVRKDFGSVLLNPGSGSGFRSGILDARLRDVLPALHIGAHGYASVSNGLWASGDTAVSASVFGIGATLYRRFAATTDDNSVALVVEAGPSLRGLSGDITANDGFRGRLLNTRSQWFGGVEGGMAVTVNNVTAAFQLYRLWDFSGRSISGLTNGQITTGISVQGKLFSFKSLLKS